MPRVNLLTLPKNLKSKAVFGGVRVVVVSLFVTLCLRIFFNIMEFDATVAEVRGLAL